MIRETRLLMGMPVTLVIVDTHASHADIEREYLYLEGIDRRFSTYKPTSEISRLNRGELTLAQASDETRLIFALADQTKQETHGYFNIEKDGYIDPSGLVKGWAIQQVANRLAERGFANYMVDIGGDIQTAGHGPSGSAWRLGVQNPFNPREIVKVVQLNDGAIATSGTYIRGQHIYNPYKAGPITDLVSLTVVGRRIYDVDRFATAAFAMAKEGVTFIDRLDGYEAYMIDSAGHGVATRGFIHYEGNDEDH